MNQNSTTRLIILVLVVLVVAGIAFFGYSRMSNNSSGNNASQDLSDRYQSVFLTNGQVYFGKITEESDNEVVLKDIYYLQVNQTLQPVEGQPTPTAQQPEITLIKLGSELHGPQDEMKINRDHILFIEVMKDDSKVVDAIKNYQANPDQKQNNQQNTQPQNTPAVTPATEE